MNPWTEVLICRVCSTGKLLGTLNLGLQPLANAFVEKIEMEKEEDRFPLRLAVCPSCFSVQLQDTLDPNVLFSRNYYYLTSASAPLTRHFEAFGERIAKELRLQKNDLVVEMGSNDGVLLSAILPYARVLGVDPAHNVALEARKRGVPTMQAFFGE